jgi:aryl-alcohol dehydrogenase-like predicted oxidoreductase
MIERRSQITVMALCLLARVPTFTAFVRRPTDWRRNCKPQSSSFKYSAGSCLGSHGRTRQTLLLDTIAPRDPYAAPRGSFTNFWYSEKRTDQQDADEKTLPCVTSLDREGRLPPGAYLQHEKDSASDPKETCRLSVAIDIARRKASDEDVDPQEMVQSLHRYIDSGLTTFALRAGTRDMQTWGEENVFGRLQYDTPDFVLNQCQFIVSYCAPAANTKGVSAQSIRRDILESLSRIGTDALDTVQLQYQSNSPFHLDALDVLEDLKRDGLVRSVTGRNFPTRLLRAANANRFRVDACQLDFNLLDPSTYDIERQLTCADLKSPMYASSVLAGGYLTDRYREVRFEPAKFLLTPSERHHRNTSFRVWCDRREVDQGDMWKHFQTTLLSTMVDLALKYRVSVASIALRWALQLDHVGSAVVSCRWRSLEEDNFLRKSRPQQLRQIFTFELDDEDMERLWAASGRAEIPPSDTPWDFEEEEEFLMKMERDSGLFLPSSSHRTKDSSNNKQLWL